MTVNCTDCKLHIHAHFDNVQKKCERFVFLSIPFLERILSNETTLSPVTSVF